MLCGEDDAPDLEDDGDFEGEGDEGVDGGGEVEDLWGSVSVRLVGGWGEVGSRGERVVGMGMEYSG